jgi:hypothetical protein
MRGFFVCCALIALHVSAIQPATAADIAVFPLPTCNVVDLEDQTDCLIARAIRNKDRAQVERYLTTPYANPSRPTRHCGNHTYYGCAATWNFPEIFPVLADAGGNPNVGGTSEPTWLHVEDRLRFHRNYAALPGVFDALIRAGLDPNAFWEAGNKRTLLSLMMQYCWNDEPTYTAISLALVRAGADVFRRGPGNRTVWHEVFRYGSACSGRIFDRMGLGTINKARLESAGVYSDNYGATLVDYSMTVVDIHSRPLCQYRPDLPWTMANWLAQKDPRVQAEIDAKRGLMFQHIQCTDGRIAAGLL